MKKLMMVGLTLAMLGGTVGCSEVTDKDQPKGSNENSQSHQVNELNKEKKVKDLKMSIKSLKVKKDESIKKDEKLVEVSIAVKNIGKEDTGVGAGDFYLVDRKGKKYEMYGNEENFGALVKASGELKGKSYYVVPKNSKNLSIVYSKAVDTSKDKKTLEWDIGTPKE
ncbi:DUF4352 domain-containing protein [Carnobacterium maltaromaticum]|uniref:DUF4352 domain-containing protein n=1 Tax=Carnobacterium maltaromaticum TaxID=2751 RepID=UPI00191BC194|nr:DUF4352 domain-containing protein [Carnobacterium maltaromaticum]CAD5896524.1 conserved exported hypothetical protein [Carnobacterium maltaromaticum]